MSRRSCAIGLLGSAALLGLVVLPLGAGAAPRATVVTNAMNPRPAAQAPHDSIDVSDQPLVDGSITIADVSAAQDGWIVAHKDEGGHAGKVIGFTPVKRGDNRDVQIKLDEDVPVGGVLWPMLHVDAGTIGVYEFPGPDAAVIVNGDFLVKRMTITAGDRSGSPNVVGLLLGGLALLVAGVIGVLLARRRGMIIR
jgi:hypothetical protein